VAANLHGSVRATKDVDLLIPSGVFTAPWDGIHGWYLKNDSPKDVVVKLELAGFYGLESK